MKIDPGPAPGLVPGFRFAGVDAGLKAVRKRDFALIVADEGTVSAAAFTRNRFAAAPVVVAREHSKGGRIRAIVVNSGNANAATGAAGLEVARYTCEKVGAQLGIGAGEVLPCSTGVIGVPLKKSAMAAAVKLGASKLTADGFEATARAIMTSDAFPKWAERTVNVGVRSFTVAGMAKGAGMIEPNMATMLSFILTDAPLSATAARQMLRDGLANSFNRITVDGDTSTNDTCALLASGAAGGAAIRSPKSPGYAEVAGAVVALMDELSRMCVIDGEGATKMVDIVVTGATDDRRADRAARTIANSTLLRCALAGADPNWGRIVMALGNIPFAIDSADLDVDVAGVGLARAGSVISAKAVEKARAAMRSDSYTISVRIGRGPGRAVVVTSDLTEAYVHFNSAYTS